MDSQSWEEYAKTLEETKVVPIEPTEEMIDAPRSFLLFYSGGICDYERMRANLELSRFNKDAMPPWFWTEKGHITKAAAAMIIYYLMIAAAE